MSYALTANQLPTYLSYAQLRLPRHTSYPAANHWEKTFVPSDAESNWRDLEAGPVSLYVHVPFCEKLCFYCACSKLVVPRQERGDSEMVEAKFLHGIERELATLKAINPKLTIQQLHLGGGTPTYLQAGNMRLLLEIIEESFPFAAQAERSCEIDPRVTSHEHLETLRELGFDRLSLGIQDFDPKVQTAIHRLQSYELVKCLVEDARAMGFRSLNFDLIYGLPFQTLASMRETLDKVLSLSPDRVAFFRLALIPELFRTQKLFAEKDVPEGELPLRLMELAIETFLANGYEYIGLDHFAKVEERLETARESGELQRNFQGMTNGKSLPLVGIGPSAISTLPNAFWQNSSNFHRWLAATELGLPVERGHRLSPDDKKRNAVLQEIYCHRRISKSAFEREFSEAFDAYFHSEQDALRNLVREGLLQVEADGYSLTRPLGHFLMRVVASVFDAYLPSDAYRLGCTQGSRVG